MIHPTRINGIAKVLWSPIVFICRQIGEHFPEPWMKFRYYMTFHKKLNLDNPQTLNEKILYLSLRTNTDIWTPLADKYKVRDYVKSKGLEGILVKNYGYWTKVEDIDITDLPNQFVIKTTHGQGDVMIVKDKSTISNEQIRKYFKPYLKQKYGALEGARHYLRIPPGVIAEALLPLPKDENGRETTLDDYKFWCFNGKAYYVWYMGNRKEDFSKDNMIFDMDWKPYPQYIVYSRENRQAPPMPKLKNFDKMIEIAEKLSEGMPCVRVDLYNINGDIYFGEMTFTSTGGLIYALTEEFQQMAGSLIELPS